MSEPQQPAREEPEIAEPIEQEEPETSGGNSVSLVLPSGYKVSLSSSKISVYNLCDLALVFLEDLSKQINGTKKENKYLG